MTPLTKRLHQEIIGGNLTIVKSLIEGGADVKEVDDDGRTALHIAIRQGHVEIVKELLHVHDVDINAFDKLGRTPLQVAAEKGNEDIVKLLLAIKDVDVNAYKIGCLSALGIAVFFGKKEVVKLLIADTRTNLRGSYSLTPLHIAAFRGKTEVAKLLLADEYINAKEFNGTIPVHVVDNNGKVNVVSELSSYKKLNINAVDSNGNTPLHLAAGKGHSDIVRLLSSHKKIDINAVDHNGMSSLHHAAVIGHKEVINILLDNGAMIENKTNEGCTALDVAAGNNHYEVMELLFKRGAKININKFENWTALHSAAGKNYCKPIELLLENGADVDVVNNKWWTPLHIAASEGNIDAVKVLLSKGAKVDPIGDKGWTPLHFTAHYGHYEAAKILLAANDKNVNTRLYDGRTALHIAIQKKYEDVAKALLSNDKINVNVKWNGKTPLQYAVDNECLTLINACLINQRTTEKCYSKAFLSAIQSKKSEIIKVFLNSKLYQEGIESTFPKIIYNLSSSNLNVKDIIFLANSLKNNSITKNIYIKFSMDQAKNLIEVLAKEKNNSTSDVNLIVNCASCDFNKNAVIDFAHYIKHRQLPKGIKLEIAVSYIGIAGWKAICDIIEKQATKDMSFTFAFELDINIIKLIADALKNSNRSTENLTISFSNPDNISKTGIHYLAEAIKSGNAPKGLHINFDGDISSRKLKSIFKLIDAVSSGSAPEGCLISFPKDSQFPKEIRLSDDLKPLFGAIRENDLKATKRYFDHFNEKTHDNRITKDRALYEGLLLSCHNNNYDIAKYLVEQGAPLDFDDKESPLIVACKKGYIDITKLLFDYDANSNATSFEGETPLQVAKANGNKELTTYIVYRLESLKERSAEPDWEWKNFLCSIRNNNSNYKSIRLSNKNDHDIKQLCKALKNNTQVTSLNFEGCKLTDIGVRYLSQTLANLTNITELNIIDTELSDEGMKDLANLLSQHHTLKSLQLGHSKQDESSAPLFSIFSNLRPTITSKGIKKLTNALKNNHSLQMLNLQHITRTQNLSGFFNLVDSFRSMFAHNYMITELKGDFEYLQYGHSNTVSESEHKEIQSYIQRNKNLSHLVTAIDNEDINKIDKIIDANCFGEETIPWVLKIAYNHEKHDLIKYLIQKRIDLNDSRVSEIQMICKNGLFNIVRKTYHADTCENKDNILPHEKDYLEFLKNSIKNRNADTKYFRHVHLNDNLNAINQLKAKFVDSKRKQDEGFNDDFNIYIEPDVGLTKSETLRFPLSDAIDNFLYDDKNTKLSLLLLGESGLGKTLYAKRLENKVWQAWEEKTSNYIPIYIPLKLVNQNALSTNLIYDYLETYKLSTDQILFLKKICQENKCRLLLILDGYDELTWKPDKSLYLSNNWLDDWGSPKIIKLSRPEAFNTKDNYQTLFYPNLSMKDAFYVLYMKSFTASQIDSYLTKLEENNFRCKEYKDLYHIYPYHELAQNPLTLSMLVKIMPRLVYTIRLFYDKTPTESEIMPNTIALYLDECDDIQIFAKDSSGKISYINISEELCGEDVQQSIKKTLKDSLNKQELSACDEEAIFNITSTAGCFPNLSKVINKIDHYYHYLKRQIYPEFINYWLERKAIRILSNDAKRETVISCLHPIFRGKNAEDEVKLKLELIKSLDEYLTNLARIAWKKSNGVLYTLLTNEDTLSVDVLNVDDDVRRPLKRGLIKSGLDDKYYADHRDSKNGLLEFLEILRLNSLLLQNQDHWQFLHKSILEYYVTKNMSPEATDILTVSNYVKFKYPRNVSTSFTLHDHLLLDEPNLIRFLANCAQTDSKFREKLKNVIPASQSKSASTLSNAAANAITILKVIGESFAGEDFSNTHLAGADLSGANLVGTNFSGANLQGANFSGTICDSTNFAGANLSSVNFDNAWLQNADFTGAKLNNVYLSHARKTHIPDIYAMTHDTKGQLITYKPCSQKFYFHNENNKTIENQCAINISRKSINDIQLRFNKKFKPIVMSESPYEVNDISNKLKIKLKRLYDFKILKFGTAKFVSYECLVDDVQDKEELKRYKYIFQHKDIINYFAGISPNRRYLFIGGSHYKENMFDKLIQIELQLFDMKNDKTPPLIIKQAGAIRFFQFSQNDELLVMVTDSNIYILNIKEAKIKLYDPDLTSNDKITAVSLSSNNKILAFVTKGGILYIYDIYTTKCLFKNKLFLSDPLALVTDVSLYESGHYLFVHLHDEYNNEFIFKVDSELKGNLRLINRTGNPALNCQGVSLKDAINVPVSTERIFRNNGAFGKTKKIAEVECVEDKLSVMINEPVYSRLHKNKIIKPDQCVVSLLRDTNAASHNNTLSSQSESSSSSGVYHTFMIIESMGDYNKLNLYRAEIYTRNSEEKVNKGFAKVSLYDRKNILIKDHETLVKQLCFHHNWRNRNIIDLYGKAWEVEKGKVDNLLDAIQKDIKSNNDAGKNLINYSTWGSESILTSNKGDNCYTWASKKLLSLDVKEIKDNLQNTLADNFFTNPINKLSKPPGQYNYNLHKKTSCK